ncbi:MAG: LytTR family transcriptional regulator DNA-binding domain-containing protein [Lachnospiraceae bacterium]|nr:LytTR family transcriptional regulator DNA-binding domain-containing protein [Lachnospiraceae bacterium]
MIQWGRWWILDMTVNDNKNETRRGLFIKTKKLMLDQADILYIESRAKKVEIHIAGSPECIEIYATMEELDGQLGDGFYRCHRAYIVNMAHITEYGKDSLTLTNGDKVYVAKKKYSEFVKAYKGYLQNGGVSSV